jgi:hypothetical protein
MHIGQNLALAGDEKSIGELRALFQRVDGKRPFALPMPTWLFRRVVSADLTAMREWLAHARFDADVAETRKILPQTMNFETWLRVKRA